MDCDRVSTEIIDAAMAAAGPIARFYTAGGGSMSDLRTDVSYLCEAVLEALVATSTPAQTRRRVRTSTYVGPDRRAPRP